MAKKRIRLSIMKRNIDFLAVASFGALIVATMILFKVSNDFGAHRSILEQNLNRGSFPVPPIYYALLYIFSFGIASGKTAFLAIVFLASTFIGLKYLVTRRLVGQIAFPEAFHNRNELLGKLKVNTLIRILSLSLIVITPLSFGRGLYLGKIGINVWHNSTIIAEFPFALLLFLISWKYLTKRESVRFSHLLLLIILVILIKPSYFLAFTVAFPLMSLMNHYSSHKRLKIDWQVILVVIVGLLVLFFQYVRIYGENSEHFLIHSGQKVQLMIAPFRTWRIHSSNIPFDLLMSIFYPLAFLIAYWKDIRKDQGYWYATLTFLVGLLVAILFIEAGPRDFHANYFWTVIICNYILFAYSASMNLRFILARSRLLKKDYVLGGIFTAHVISGIYYIINLYVLKSF